MKNKFFFLSPIITAIYSNKIFCQGENISDKTLSIDEENTCPKDDDSDQNVPEETVNLFQFSLESVQQILSTNPDTIKHVKKFLDSIILQNDKNYNSADYLDSYFCLNHLSLLNLKNLQNQNNDVELLECYIDLKKINNDKNINFVQSKKIFFFIKSLINEYFSTLYPQKNKAITSSILNTNVIKKFFSFTRYKQRLNRFIKETFKIKKNVDYSQYLYFVTVGYKKNFSADSFDSLCSKYGLFQENDNIERYENDFLILIKDLRRYDIEYNDFQNSLDIITQNILNNPCLIKIFLQSLIDRPIFMTMKNREVSQNIHFLIYNYCNLQ